MAGPTARFRRGLVNGYIGKSVSEQCIFILARHKDGYVSFCGKNAIGTMTMLRYQFTHKFALEHFDTSRMVDEMVQKEDQGYPICPECEKRLLHLHYHLMRVSLQAVANVSAAEATTYITSTETSPP
jgi:hypothetical protein